MKFVIKKGKHYPIGYIFKYLKFHFNLKEIEYECILTEDDYWDEPRNSDDLDLNKLCGLGFGLNHHKNSVRVAWRPQFANESGCKKTFLLYGYVYDDKGSHKSKYCTKITIRNFIYKGKRAVKFKVKIRKELLKYYITINGVTISIDNTSKDKKWGRYLWPYAGGDNTAICKLLFYINIIKKVKT